MPKGMQYKKYTGEFKQKVIEDMLNNKLSYGEIKQKYDLPNNRVQNWERIYLSEGSEGLYVERRGKACTANGTKKGRPTKFTNKVENDLLDEVQRLRAEVEYLKKLNALVAERVQLEKKQK